MYFLRYRLGVRGCWKGWAVYPFTRGKHQSAHFGKFWMDGRTDGRTMWTTMIPTKDDDDDDDYCTFSSDWFGRSVGHEEMLSKGWAV